MNVQLLQVVWFDAHDDDDDDVYIDWLHNMGHKLSHVK